MTSRRRPDGFLMHDSWRADVVLARRSELAGGVRAALDRLSSAWGVAGDDGTCVWFERALDPGAAQPGSTLR